MRTIEQHPLNLNQAGLWLLGQAGHVIRSGGINAAINPYSSNSAAATATEFGRLLPVPVEPEDLRVDLWIVTHDHVAPETFRWFFHQRNLPTQCAIPTVLTPFVW